MLFGKHINKYYKKYFWYFIAGLIALLLVDYFQLIVPEALGQIVDLFDGDDIGTHINEVYKLIIKVLIVAVVMFLGRAGWRLAILSASKSIESDLRDEMFQKATMLSTRYYHSTNVGNILSIFSTDTETIQEYFGWGTIMVVDAVFLNIITFIKMFKLNVLLTLITLVPLILIVLWGMMVEKWESLMWGKRQKETDKLFEFAQESFAGIRVIKAFVKETHEVFAFSKIAKKNYDANVNFMRISVAFESMISIIIALICCLILGFGSWLVYSVSNGSPITILGYEFKLTAGELITFAGFFDILVWPMIALGQIFAMRSKAKESLRRISVFLDEDVEIKDNENAIDIEDVKGEIRFNNFSFKYPDSDSYVLKNISLTIKPGELVGVVGKIGSGKSTFLTSLLRFYNFEKNQIFIDNHDIMDLSIKSVRNSIGFVPQDNFLFSDSIKNNIAFGKKDAQIEEIIDSCKFSSVDDNIATFKNGYETISGERGVTLSGGQKQRISIARAFIKDAPIMMMDDSVSAVDFKTEEEIISNIKEFRKGKTTLVIASRVSTVKTFDKIIVLKDGELEAFDTPQNLEKISPTYQKMVYLQKLEDEVSGRS